MFLSPSFSCGTGETKEDLAAIRVITVLSHRESLFIHFRKSTPSQNRQLDISISSSQLLVDDFVGELTF